MIVHLNKLEYAASDAYASRHIYLNMLQHPNSSSTSEDQILVHSETTSEHTIKQQILNWILTEMKHRKIVKYKKLLNYAISSCSYLDGEKRQKVAEQMIEELAYL